MMFYSWWVFFTALYQSCNILFYQSLPVQLFIFPSFKFCIDLGLFKLDERLRSLNMVCAAKFEEAISYGLGSLIFIGAYCVVNFSVFGLFMPLLEVLGLKLWLTQIRRVFAVIFDEVGQPVSSHPFLVHHTNVS
ncbi:hypothetical protein ACOSQ4_013096 [Xanthoceras sorbifolium]